MGNINELTEDCLIWLFSQFSLQELIELRKVCQLWTVIIEQICQRKKSLKLFRTLKAMSNYSSHLMQFKLQTDAKMLLKPIGNDDELVGCDWNEVSNLFTNVEHLVYYDSSEQFDEIVRAMPNITNLTLPGFDEEIRYFSESIKEKRIKSLESLNRLAFLKHLNLDGNFVRSGNKFPDIEFLSKLESFNIINYHEDIMQIINQLGEPLRKLSLNVHVNFEMLDQLFKEKPEVFTNLTNLSIKSHYNITESQKLFHFVCENVHLLETFEFGSISSFKQDEIIFSLAKLKNLTELRVEGMWDVENSLLTDKLEQITKLQLKFNGYDHVTFPQMAVLSIFPNLESITVLALENEFLNSAKRYLVEEHKLTCKTQFDLIKTDSLIYLGSHRKQYEIEEERRRILEEEKEARERWYDKCGYDDYDPYDRDDQISYCSQESFIEDHEYVFYDDFC